MLDLHLSEQELHLLSALVAKREEEIQKKSNQEATNRLTDLSKRGILASSFSVSTASALVFKQVRERVYAWISSVTEVLATSGKAWTSDFAEALCKDIDNLLERSAASHFDMISANAVGRSIDKTIIGAVSSDQAVTQIREAYHKMRLEIHRDLDILVCRSDINSESDITASRTGAGMISHTLQKTVINQNINMNNCSVGQMSVSSGDNSIQSQAVSGASAEEIKNILDQIGDILQRDATISMEQREEALCHLAKLTEEVKKPEPQGELILNFIGHIANVASVTELASKLGFFLGTVVIPRLM